MRGETHTCMRADAHAPIHTILIVQTQTSTHITANTIHKCKRMHTRTQAYTIIDTKMLVYRYIHTNRNVYTQVHAHAHNTCTYAHMHMTHTHTHIHAHTHTHTCTHRSDPRCIHPHE